MPKLIQPRVMLDIADTVLTDEDRELLMHPAVGGVIIFSRNIESRGQLTALLASIRALRPELLLAVDQEGGRVQRLKDGVVRLPAMRRIGEVFEGDEAKVASFCLGRLMAADMLAVGFDISFAPVLDIDYGNSEVIGDRSFGADVATVTELAAAFIQGMHAAGMAATGKHFPGHGYVAADSHLALPIDDRSKADIIESDLRPFAQLASMLDGIMPAHVIYSQLDSKAAGFSSYWLQTVLRQQLAFKGAIFSDDLSMAGARAAGGVAESCYAALAAGCDMVLVCNDRNAAIEVVEAVSEWSQTAEAALSRPLPTLAARAGKSMQPHEYYEASRYAELLC